MVFSFVFFLEVLALKLTGKPNWYSSATVNLQKQLLPLANRSGSSVVI